MAAARRVHCGLCGADTVAGMGQFLGRHRAVGGGRLAALIIGCGPAPARTSACASWALERVGVGEFALHRAHRPRQIGFGRRQIHIRHRRDPSPPEAGRDSPLGVVGMKRHHRGILAAGDRHDIAARHRRRRCSRRSGRRRTSRRHRPARRCTITAPRMQKAAAAAGIVRSAGIAHGVSPWQCRVLVGRRLKPPPTDSSSVTRWMVELAIRAAICWRAVSKRVLGGQHGDLVGQAGPVAGLGQGEGACGAVERRLLVGALGLRGSQPAVMASAVWRTASSTAPL